MMKFQLTTTNSSPMPPLFWSPRSPAPTLEEVNAWAQSFDKLMVTPAGRNAFREFLRTEFSEENMLFWMACEELKKEANKNIIEEKARIIYEDYISILSPKEVCDHEMPSPKADGKSINLVQKQLPQAGHIGSHL